MRRPSFRAHGSSIFSGRPTARNLARYGTETQDTFGYNTRSELTTARVNSADYSYAYDAIGNRTSATEAGTRTAYTANKLNQYSAEGSFRPTFDADGNQTLIKTSTGIWNVTYNAKNRPVRFEKADSSIVVECTYDTMGRRATKKVTTNGTLTEHRRFLYRGYLQIDSPPPHRRLTPSGQSRFAHCPTGLTAVGRLACCDLSRAYTPALWFITWESPRRLGGGLDKHEVFAPKGRAGNGVPASQPTQPTATRPLAIQINGTWYTYGWDITKNICELYSTSGSISLSYAYTPFGSMTASGRITQHIQWSSEFYDDELGLSCYNYRYYNPVLGKWINRDFIDNNEALKNLYMYCFNNVFKKDLLGLYPEDASLALFLFYMANPVPWKLIDGPEPEIERYEGAIYDIETLLPGIAAEIFGLIVNKHKIPKNVQDQIDEQVKSKIKIEVTQNKKNQGESKDVYRTHRGYDFYDVLFALGGGTVYTESEYSYSWCGLPSGRNISYDWHAKMNIYYADIFIEPFYTKIFGYGIGIQKMESGNPFAYFHNWTDTDAIPLKNRGFVDV